MRLSHAGRYCTFLLFLTLLTAVSSGNNLLYLLASSLAALFAVGAAWGRRLLGGLQCQMDARASAARGAETSVPVFVRNGGPFTAFDIRFAHDPESQIDSLAPGESRTLLLRCRLPHRVNAFTGLHLESRHPFGLLVHRRRVEGLIVRTKRESPPQAAKRGEDEFYGVREYTESEDSRRINWKLTARTGRPMVNEYRGASNAPLAPPRGDGEPEENVPGLAELKPLAGAQLPPAPDAARWLTRAAGLLVYASLFLLDELPPRRLLALGPLLAAGLWLEYRGGPWLPRRVGDAVSLVVLAFILLVDWRHAGVTVAVTHLLAYILLNRSLSALDSAGTVFFVYFLNFLLISGQTISLWYFASFLAFFALSGLWLCFAESGLRWEPTRRWAPSLAALLCSALLLSAGAFAAIPRLEPRYRLNPMAALGLDKMRATQESTVAFSEQVSLGFFGRLKRSSVRALRVTPVEAPPSGGLLIRGTAYDRFDGRSWSRSRADFRYRFRGRTLASAGGRGWSVQREGKAIFPVSKAPKSRAFDFTVYPMNLSVLFSPGTFDAVEGSAAPLSFDHTDSAYFAQPHSAGARYRVSAGPGKRLSDSMLDYERLLRERYLQLPRNLDRRIPAMARDWAGAAEQGEKAETVVELLRRRYDYSTFSSAKRHSLEEFLFDTRSGNCEYFASAAAILLRTLGIPTRLVTGFAASDWNEFGGFWDIRQSDAHAWIEAYLPPRGWIAFDPTPPSETLRSTLIGRWRRYVEAMEGRWYRHVIGYDQYTQRNTFYRAKLRLEKIDFPAALRRWKPAWTILLCAAGLSLARLLWRARVKARRCATAFDQAQRWLEKSGLPRQPHQTPLEYARSICSLRPELSDLLALAHAHYRAVYGPGPGPEERRECERRLARLRELVE